MTRPAALSLLVATAAAVLAPAATSAAAAGEWRPVNGAERGLLSDGDRYVVTVSRSRAARVIDTVTERRRRLESPPCDSGRSEPSALGSGMLVTELGDGKPAPDQADDIRAHDATAGAGRRPPPRADAPFRLRHDARGHLPLQAHAMSRLGWATDPS